GTRYLVRRELLRGSGPRDRIVSIDVQVLLFDSYSFVSVHLLRRPAGFELIGTAYKLDSWRPISPRRRRRASGSSTSTDRPKGARRLTAAWSAGKSRTTTPLPSRSTIWSPTRRAKVEAGGPLERLIGNLRILDSRDAIDARRAIDA